MDKIYKKLFKHRHWNSWNKFINDMELLSVKYEKLQNVGNFKYDSINISSKDLSINLYKFQGREFGEKKVVGKILSNDIDLSYDEIEEKIGYQSLKKYN